MKPAHLKKALLLPSALLTLSLVSCADPSFSGGYSGNGNGNGSGYNSYTTLPQNYSGNAYLVDGRYYSGGQYQTGNYNYQGRAYPNRYYHNGQYYYGGNHTAYGNAIAAQNNGNVQQTGYRTYTTLPQNYSGNAYLLDGRYYSGGQYQTGNYNYQGRAYPNRYYYNGQYYYGGNHTAYGDAIAAPNNGFIQ